MNKSNTTSIPAILQAAPHEEHWIESFYFFLAIAEILIVITALAGNLIVVYAFIAYTKLRANVTNYFIISLAVNFLFLHRIHRKPDSAIVL